MQLIDVVLTGMAAASALVSVPAESSAAFTPDGGPQVNFVGSDITFTNIQADQELNCAQIDFAGTVVDPGGARPFGENAGVLDDLTASGCTNDIAGTTTVVLTGTPSVSITGDATGTEWPARLSDVSAVITAAGCSFTVEGSVDGLFDTVTQVVTPTDNTLTIVEITGFLCPIGGLFEGQTFTVDGSWTNVPPPGSGPLLLAPGDSTSFTPQGGPDTHLVGSAVSLTSIQADQTVTCPQLDLEGELLNTGVSRQFGAEVAEIVDLSSSGCTNSIAGSVVLEPLGVWSLSVSGGPTGAQWPVQLGDVSVNVSSAGCEFSVAGSLDGIFDPTTQVLTPTTSALQIADVPAGFLCPILGVAQGQGVEVHGSWTNVPPAGSGPLTLARP